MQRSEFDSSFSLYKLSELIEKFPSKRKLKEFLQTFPCSINPDLEDFLNNKAVTFEKHLRSRTYIYIDNQTKKVAAYFTIAISTLHTEGISSEVIKMLDGYQDDTTSIPCFLIGQLGKSSEYQYKKIGEYITFFAQMIVMKHGEKNIKILNFTMVELPEIFQQRK